MRRRSSFYTSGCTWELVALAIAAPIIIIISRDLGCWSILGFMVFLAVIGWIGEFGSQPNKKRSS